MDFVPVDSRYLVERAASGIAAAYRRQVRALCSESDPEATRAAVLLMVSAMLCAVSVGYFLKVVGY